MNDHLVVMRRDSPICKSEGFSVLTRIRVSKGTKTVVASLLVTDDLKMLHSDEIGLTQEAIRLLGAKSGDLLSLSHLSSLNSMSDVRSKIYGNKLTEAGCARIVDDIVSRSLSNVQLSAFLAACATGMNVDETIFLTKAMLRSSTVMKWDHLVVLDKHCIGGLPGNRTSPIVVSIIAATGLVIPKTSSRAITSPAGTADTMDALTTVNLSVSKMRKVVEKEGGCLVWGGSVQLSPADDILIRVERTLDLDSQGQMIASVLSKKVAAGSTHVVIDIPVGPTAKIRSFEIAHELKERFISVGAAVGLTVEPIFSDGRQPVGRGIGPVLEAYDVLAVLQNDSSMSTDLKNRSVLIAGKMLEIGGKAKVGEGSHLAEKILNSGEAWLKFQAICQAQGGLKTLKKAAYSEPVLAQRSGIVSVIDNRRLARVAKLAGAPHDPAAGVYLFAGIGAKIEKGQPLFEVYSEAPGQLAYALDYVAHNPYLMEMHSS